MIEYVDEAANLIPYKDRRKIEKKVLPEYCKGIRTHKKMFEIRKDDDDIHPGDILVLREWDGKKYTGGRTRREVTAVLRDCPEYGLMEGYCILSLQTPGWNHIRPAVLDDSAADQKKGERGLVIPDRELPVCCGECPCFTESPMRICKATGDLREDPWIWKCRSADCPLIETEYSCEKI